MSLEFIGFARWSIPEDCPSWRDGMTRKIEEDARRKLEVWRVDYNTVRPHSSLGDRSPSELLEAHHQEVPEASTLNL